MKRIFISIIFCLISAFSFASSNGELAGLVSLTVPFSFGHDSWDDKPRDTNKNGYGIEAQIRMKPYGSFLGIYGQLALNHPSNITEKYNSYTLTSKASDYSTLFSADFQTGLYVVPYASENWYIPVGFGLHYNFDFNEVIEISTQQHAYGIGAFVNAECKISKCLSAFIGANFSFDLYGSAKKQDKDNYVYYRENGSLTLINLMPKIGFVLSSR